MSVHACGPLLGAAATETSVTLVTTLLCLPESEAARGICPRNASHGVFMTVLENGRGDWRGFVLPTDATTARIIECMAGPFGSNQYVN
jgi:hypothetical protein